MKLKSEIDNALTEIEVLLRYPSENAEIKNIKAILLSLEKKIIGSDGTGKKVIPIQNIFYIEAVNRKVFIYTENAIYETDQRLYEVLNALKDLTFFQVSKQIVVNLNRVSYIKQEIGSRLLLTMDNGEKIIVSRQYAPIIKKELGIL